MLDVLFFLGGNGRKSLAKTSRPNPSNPRVASNGKRFEHDFLHDQAANKVALCDPAHECFAKPLPVLCFNVARHRYSNSATLGGERSGMTLLALCMFQRVRYFCWVFTYHRE